MERKGRTQLRKVYDGIVLLHISVRVAVKDARVPLSRAMDGAPSPLENPTRNPVFRCKIDR